MNTSHSVPRNRNAAIKSPSADAVLFRQGVAPNFWKTKRLDQMTPQEWEYLCDGCGKCCLYILQDNHTGVLYYTRVACQYLDLATCRCRNYGGRQAVQPKCNILRPDNLEGLDCLPSSCAYRRVARGQSLEWWHPLVSGNAATVHLAGASVRGKAISVQGLDPDELVQYIIRESDWTRS